MVYWIQFHGIKILNYVLLGNKYFEINKKNLTKMLSIYIKIYFQELRI